METKNAKAFSIFLQHWMKDENEMKKRQFKERLYEKQIKACEKILAHRKTIYEFQVISDFLEEMDENEQNFVWEEYFEMTELAFYLTCKIIDNHYIYGICHHCEGGLVSFRIEENGFDLSAVCRTCSHFHIYLNNLFYNGLQFLN